MSSLRKSPKISSPVDARRFVLAVCAVVASGCTERALRDPSGGEAVRVVLEVERGLARGDSGPAHEALDYAYRLEEMLGDTWRAGTDADREDLVTLSRGMFETTTERYWDTHCAGRTLERRVDQVEGAHVWVQSEVVGDPNGFRWLYRLTKRGDKWRITQRELLDNHVLRSDSTRFWPMAVRKIGTQFGRPPTLRELTANLPATMGTLRSRTFKVPDLEPRASP